MKNPFNFLKSTKEKSVTPFYSFYKQNIAEALGLTTTLSAKKATELYKSSLYINKGFSKRAEKVSEIDFILKDLKGNIIEDSEYLDLLRNPNKEMTGARFWALASTYRDVTGMAVIRKIQNGEIFREDKKIDSLELLNSNYIEIIEDTDTGKIREFRYTDPVKQKSEIVPFEECIYWHIPDPENPNKPLPLILAGLLSLQTSLDTEKQYSSILKNGGTIDGLFKFKQGLTKEQIEQVKADYAKLLKENKDSNVPMVLGGDASYERVALSPRELEALESKKQLLDDLLVITGVPKSVLGIASGDTYANAETAYKIFLRETIKPIMNDLTDTLNWKLIDDEHELDFIDPTPENIEEKLKVLEVGSRVNALTLNEKREMLGLEPKSGGDEIKEPTYYEAPPAEKTVEKKNSKFVNRLKDENVRDIYYKEFVKTLQSDRKRFKKELLDFLLGQKKRILESLKTLKVMNYTKQDDFAFDILNESLEITYMTPLLKTMRDIAEKEGIKIANQYGSQFTFNSSVDKTVDKRFKFFANTINATTAKVLKEEFADWFKNRETIAELQQRVSDVYDFRKSEKWRADMIVNTEVSTITNQAKGEAYKQIGIPTKIWVHRPGIQGGVRDDHASMDGEEVEYSKFFSNGMLHPHDPAADGSEVINCLCTW